MKKGKEEFLDKVEQFTDVFSLRDEIGTCPFIEVLLCSADNSTFGQYQLNFYFQWLIYIKK